MTSGFRNDTFCLFVKQYPEQENIFATIQRWFTKSSKNILYDPVETVMKVLSSVLKIPYERKLIDKINAEDDVYGEYPQLLVNHNVIPRENVIPFFMEIFPLDRVLSDANLKIAKELEYLCIHELHVASVTFTSNLTHH